MAEQEKLVDKVKKAAQDAAVTAALAARAAGKNPLEVNGTAIAAAKAAADATCVTETARATGLPVDQVGGRVTALMVKDDLVAVQALDLPKEAEAAVKAHDDAEKKAQAAAAPA